MRIGIVSQEYPGVTQYWGGIGAQYGSMAPAMLRQGHEVEVVTLAPRDGTAPDEVEGVRIHAVESGLGWPWHAWDWSRRIAAAMERLPAFDAVLSPEFRGEALHYARSQSKGPLLTHLCTSSAQLLSLRPGLTLNERHGLRTQIALRMERKQTARSAGTVSPGRAVLEWSQQLWPDTRPVPAEVVPMAIDAAQVRAAAASGELPEGFPSGGPIVTLASRLDGHKGAQQLVQAMHAVWESHPEAQLVFVGRDARYGHGMMSDHLRELAGARVGQVHVLGGQPADRYFAAVAASDVVAIPSLWESFCIAAVEAMALGRPVIGTRGHGFSEYIEHDRNGLLVGRGDVPELAQALDRLLAGEALRARLGAAASATADDLDADAVAPRLVAALERLA